MFKSPGFLRVIYLVFKSPGFLRVKFFSLKVILVFNKTEIL